MADRELVALSESQREIMEIIWEREEASAREVHDILCKTRDVARNTVNTLLSRMVEKGWVQHRSEGRMHLYSATRPRKASVGHRVKELVNGLCGGSPEMLMNAFLESTELSNDEFDRIRAMVNKAKRERDQAE